MENNKKHNFSKKKNQKENQTLNPGPEGRAPLFRRLTCFLFCDVQIEGLAIPVWRLEQDGTLLHSVHLYSDQTIACTPDGRTCSTLNSVRKKSLKIFEDDAHSTRSREGLVFMC